MWYLSLCIFSIGTIVSSILVITSVRAIWGIISLILAFINSIGTFILLGLDFIALIYCIVYVGAIAILFLFVIMLLNSKIYESFTLSKAKEGGAVASLPALNGDLKCNASDYHKKDNLFLLNNGALALLISVLYILTIWCGLLDISSSLLQNEFSHLIENGKLPTVLNKTNITHLGEMLYKECGYEILLIIALILLVGMIGTIILCN